MEQTLAEKLRILADAAEAGEAIVLIGDKLTTLQVAMYYLECGPFSRTPPKPATIKVGNREINAPLRVTPKEGEEYWYFGGGIWQSNWDNHLGDVGRFDNANCWATKEDAEAYRDASMAVRKGEV